MVRKMYFNMRGFTLGFLFLTLVLAQSASEIAELAVELPACAVS